MFNRNTLVLILAMASVAAGGLFLAGKPMQSPSTPVSPQVRESPANPLSIAAMRQHPTPGGDIAVEQTLAPRAGCATSVISYPSDGLKLYSLMSQPQGLKPAEGYPVVILNHGYVPPGYWQTAGTDYQAFIDAYCNAGYLVFKPDYRGHAGSQGDTASGHFSPDYTYDVLNLVHALKNLELADESRLAMLGHSMGAHIALRAAVVEPKIKATVYAAGVVASLEDIAYNWRREDQIPANFSSLRKRMLSTIGSPNQNPEFWHDGSAINYVDAVSGPSLIIHGTADTEVPVFFSERLNAALEKNNKPHQFIAYPGADHNFSPVRQQAINDSLAFLDKNVKQ